MATYIPVDALIPGGIRATDFIHIRTNDGTCSRCRKEVPDEQVPLMLWLPPNSKRMLIYCEDCIGEQAHANMAPIVPG